MILLNSLELREELLSVESIPINLNKSEGLGVINSFYYVQLKSKLNGQLKVM